MTAKRIFFYVVLIVFVSLTLWWILYFPFSRERLYRAIPSNATLVSEHKNLAERWQFIARNPLTLCLLSTAGFRQSDLKKDVMDPGLVKTIKRFAGKDTVIGYIPSLNGEGDPAWVLSSWVGGSCQLMRWTSARVMAKSNLKKETLDGGRQVWVVADANMSPSDPGVSLAVVEGVLVACLSSDRTGVRHLINRIESGAPLHADLRKRLSVDVSLNAEGGMVDCGWFKWHEASGDDFRVRQFEYALTSFGEKTCAGWVRGDADLMIPKTSGVGVTTNGASMECAARLCDSSGLEMVERALPIVPDAFAVFPFSFVEPLLSGRKASRGVRIISRMVKAEAETNSAAFVSMFGGDLSGRLLGLKVPSLVAGVCVKNEANVMAKVPATIDTLNALYRGGMIPRREDISGHPVVALDSTQSGIYGSIAATDKPAVTARDRWFMIASSMGTLTNALCGSGTADAKWLKGRSVVGPCSCYAWINIQSAGQAIKNAIAAYTLVLIAQNSEGTGEMRQKLGMVRTWIDVLTPLKEGELWLSFADSEFELRFKFGAE